MTAAERPSWTVSTWHGPRIDTRMLRRNMKEGKQPSKQSEKLPQGPRKAFSTKLLRVRLKASSHFIIGCKKN